MAHKVRAVPDGLHTITPSLIVKDANKAIDFYKRAFGAEAKAVHRSPEGKVMHAELQIGNSRFFLSDENPGMNNCQSPQTTGSVCCAMNIYTENADKLYNQATNAGATVTMPLENMFWGDRWGQVRDPSGHLWSIAQHVEDVSPEELDRRGREFFSKMSKPAGMA